MVNESVFKPVISELIQYYYNNLGNTSGGYCHIVLDDGNLDSNSIWFCQELCEKNNDEMGYLIMTILRTCDIKEREKIYNNKEI